MRLHAFEHLLGHLVLSDNDLLFLFFFFNDTPTTEIYTLSLHDALPIYLRPDGCGALRAYGAAPLDRPAAQLQDRKSTRLNSSHVKISYAVFCLKKKTSHIKRSPRSRSPRSVRHRADSRHRLSREHATHS